MKYANRVRRVLGAVFGLVVLAALVIFFGSRSNQAVFEPVQRLSAVQQQQFSKDPAFQGLLAEKYRPIELHLDEFRPKVLLVHCAGADGSCDKAPYTREFPAVLVQIEREPAVGEFVRITEVAIVTRRYASNNKHMSMRSCAEPMTSPPTLQGMRDVIAKVIDENGYIPANAKIIEVDGSAHWRCDYKP